MKLAVRLCKGGRIFLNTSLYLQSFNDGTFHRETLTLIVLENLKVVAQKRPFRCLVRYSVTAHLCCILEVRTKAGCVL